MDQTYEIMNGVRRAKAAQMAGHQTIRVKLYAKGGAKLIREFDVLISALRSPHKSSIARISLADQNRWQSVVDGAKQAPLLFPAVEIVEGSRGVKVEDISFDFGVSP